MDIETATRPRDGEGLPDDALAVASVHEDSGTAAAFSRPAFLNRSPRFDITEAQVGEMTARVWKSRAYLGSAIRFLSYEIAWRGKVLWSEHAGDDETAREVVEAASVDLADQLNNVVWRVGGLLVDGPDRPCWDVRNPAAPVIWTALPDEIEEPRT